MQRGLLRPTGPLRAQGQARREEEDQGEGAEEGVKEEGEEGGEGEEDEDRGQQGE